MSPRQILIAEDDPAIREALVESLTADGHTVTAAPDGARALNHLQSSRYDLILLDLMLPKVNGYDLCRRIRETDKHVPILILSAKGEEIDKVLGLELGADDYITKPFGQRELLARVHAALRRSENVGGALGPDLSGPLVRSENPESPNTFPFGPATIDRRRYTCTLGKTMHPLSARELHLLEFFTRRRGEVLTRDQLLNEVWGINYQGTTRTLDQHIAQLRKKLGPTADRLIKTIHGTGYQYLG